MQQNTKDWIQYISAVALIASAIILVFTSFLTIERVGEGVNTYVGIAISGGLAIFGVAALLRQPTGFIQDGDTQGIKQYKGRGGKKT